MPTAPPDGFPGETEVAIIGGGIAGVATAYFLAKAGVPVTVFEKGRIAAEQSSRNWGWVRKQGRDPRELPAAIESLRIWEGLERELGEDIGWHVGGVTYLGETDADMARFEQWLGYAKEHQLDSRLLSPAQTDALVGQDGRRWKGALLTPSDGRAEPTRAVPAMARGAARMGARFHKACAVRAIETEAGRVTGVITEHGRVGCRVAVCAAGAWSALFNKNLGLALPQLGVRGSVLRTAPAPLISESALWCKDVSVRRRQDGGYTIARSGMVSFELVPDAFRWFRTFLPALRMNAHHTRLRLGRKLFRELVAPTRWAPDAVTPFERTRILDPEPDRGILDDALAIAQRLFPQLAGVGVAHRWACTIDATPDALPVICAADAPQGYYILTGMSGHGFGMGPGAGLLMSELILRGEARVDLSPFRLSRFFDGTPMRPYAPV